MSIDWDADLLAPVMAAFAQDTVYITPKVGGPTVTVLDAVFDEGYKAVLEGEDGANINTSSPIVGVRASLFSWELSQGDLVVVGGAVVGGKVIGGRRFLIADPNPDSHGHVLLILSEL